jgi:hypothetical protein
VTLSASASCRKARARRTASGARGLAGELVHTISLRVSATSVARSSSLAPSRTSASCMANASWAARSCGAKLGARKQGAPRSPIASAAAATSSGVNPAPCRVNGARTRTSRWTSPGSLSLSEPATWVRTPPRYQPSKAPSYTTTTLKDSA